jgi:hypothetical protein
LSIFSIDKWISISYFEWIALFLSTFFIICHIISAQKLNKQRKLFLKHLNTFTSVWKRRNIFSHLNYLW